MLFGEVLIVPTICIIKEKTMSPWKDWRCDFNFTLSAEFLYYITIFEYPRLAVVVLE